MTQSGILVVADEDVDGGITRSLRAHGFEVRSVTEDMKGSSDEEVLQRAILLKALLITQDKGYGRLVRRYGLPEKGIILVRLVGWSSERKANTVLRFFQDHANELSGKFAVLETNGYRIAPWP